MKFHLEKNISLTSNTEHNAFTDLFMFEGVFFCAYRKASSHMSLDGSIEILTSNGGEQWQHFQSIQWAGGDLRDPKFTIDKNGSFLFISAVRLSVPASSSSSSASLTWKLKEDKFECIHNEISTWRWSAQLVNNEILSVGYSGKDISGTLYKSADGYSWQPILANFFPESNSYSNETSLAFDDENMLLYALVRRDMNQDCAMLGQAAPPFTKWDWRELNIRIGGPKLVLTNTGNLLAGFRVLTEYSAKMVIAQIDLESASFIDYIELPSSGDCSYPGMLLVDNELFVSYYSSHEQTTQVYFAKLSLK